jgi:AAA+ ATPase superfamily predicted ATPase
MIFRIIEQLEADRFICIYFDFMPVHSLESFVRLFARAIAEKQSSLQKFVQNFAAIVKNIRPLLSVSETGSQDFSIDFAKSDVNETTVIDLLDLIESLAVTKKKRVVVFFDEFQEVEKLHSLNFESLLRSKIQKQTRINYLFLGSKTHLLKEMFNNKKRAFYNSALPMSLDVLPEQDTVTYLQENMAKQKINISVSTAKYLIRSASYIPHYIQLLAAEVWQYMVNNAKIVTEEIIDACAERVLAANADYYLELFDRQSHSKKQLLEALAINGKNIFSTEYIKKNNLTSSAAVQRASRELIDAGIIERQQDEYFITDPFFKRFVENI